MLRSFAGVLALALLVLSAACETKTELKPIGTSTTTLPDDSRRGTLRTKFGMEIRLELPAPKESGHVWTIVQHDPRFLRPLSDVSPPSPENGKSTVSFHAVHTGRTQLKFLAVPAHGGRELLPVDSYDIVVAIE